MNCAFGIAVGLTFCSPLPAAVQEPAASVRPWPALPVSREPSPVTRPDRHALMVNLTVLGEATIRRAIDLALAKLARPGCPGVYEDFELPNGGTPRRELERLGIGPEAWLESLVFIDGSRDPICRR